MTRMNWERSCFASIAMTLVFLRACGPAPPGGQSDSTDVLGWPSYADVPHWICMGEGNTHECGLKVEDHQLRYDPPGLSRADSVFRIALSNDDTARIVDRKQAGAANTDDRVHAYLGYHPGARQHLLRVTRWESGHYLLVDPQTGERNPVGALPVVSPDSSRFAIASSSLSYGSGGSLEIWRIEGGGGIDVAWQFEMPEGQSPQPGVYRPPDWSPGDVRWLGADSLCVRIDTPPRGPGYPGQSHPLGWVVLEHDEGGWVFRPHPRELISGGERRPERDVEDGRRRPCALGNG